MSDILFSIQNGIGKITFNRPDVLNSFNMPMAKEFQAAIDDCAASGHVRSVLITGEGRAFSAGQDLTAAIAPGVEIREIVKEQYNPIILKLREIEKPVVCAVNGVAAGAGANIAFACDIVLAASSASFIQAFSKIGLIPDSAGTFFLPRLIGLQRATALMMLGEKVTAQQALDYGMIYKVFPDETLLAEAEKMAGQLASMPTKGLGYTKRLLNASLANDLKAQLQMEENMQDAAAKTYDHKEGVKAFLEKRKPLFKGGIEENPAPNFLIKYLCRMCGICGIIGLTDKELAERVISRMNAAIAHRGPNDEGVFIEPGIAFGHRRLSIIDLSKNGHQPMSSSDGRFVLVYNGELYNYKNLRLELQRLKVGDTNSAYSFKTQSDSEVIIAAYQRWGVNCVKYFNGMFAFAIWDKKKEEVFIARDRLGIKPLYYWQNNGIVFASEIRALIKSNLVPKRLDKKALCDYVAFQTVHAPATILEDIKMVLPGHYLLIKRSEINIPVKQQKYWSLQDIPVQAPEKPYDQICKDIKELFFASVERRLVADVPFGAFLSGGIDSSLVVAVMSKLMREKVRTFSISFDESEYSESTYSSQVAKLYNTEHHDIKLSPGECLFKLPDALSGMDHPSGDGINTYIVSEATKKAGITMALSGLGSDELFAGYPLFRRLHKLEKLKWVSGFPFIGTPFKLMNILRQSPSSNKLVEIAGLPDWRLENTYPVTRETFTRKELEKLVKIIIPLERKLMLNKSHDVLSSISVAELSNYLPDVLLRDTDQMSMAHALEVRVPFLDYTLVEYILGLSDKVKYPATPKKLLTDSMKGFLPENITSRRKMGFTFPWNVWMRTELKAFCEGNINSLSERSCFDKNNLQLLWKGFLKGDPNCPWYKVWHLVVLENWINENKIDA